MRPFSMRSPSSGLNAGSGPALLSTEGRTLFRPGARCHTTNNAAGRSAGRRLTSFCSASMPPAEAPITTMSLRAIPGPKQALDREFGDGALTPKLRVAGVRAPSPNSLLGLVHHQDHAFAPLSGQQRGAGDAAADRLAAAVDGVEHQLLVVGAVVQAGADRRAQLAHRQADIEVEHRLAAHLVGAQAP